jgi:hypothetical protein
MLARTPLVLSLVSALALAACASTALDSGPSDDPAAIALVPSLASIDGGATLRLTLTLRQADGSVVHPVGALWRSSDVTVASVAQSGLVRGGSPGTAEISAQWQGARTTAVVRVRPATTNKNSDPPCESALRIPKPGGTNHAGCP